MIGLLGQLIGMSLPRRWFNHKAFPYRAYAWEKNGKIYEVLNIKRWKTKLPDVSRVIKRMTPKAIRTRPTKEQVEALLAETCVAELIHGLLMLFGWGAAFIWQGFGGVAVSFAYMIGNVPFILIQRYNRPRQATLLASFERAESVSNNGGSYESAK